MSHDAAAPPEATSTQAGSVVGSAGPTAVGDVLHSVLEALGITQAELSAHTGLSQKHLSQIITGAVRMSPAVAVKIATATGIPAQVWCAIDATRLIWEAQAVAPVAPGPLTSRLRRQRDEAVAQVAHLERRVARLQAALAATKKALKLLETDA